MALEKQTRTPRPTLPSASAEKLIEEFFEELIKHGSTANGSLFAPILLRSDGMGIPVTEKALEIAGRLAKSERSSSSSDTASFSAKNFLHKSNIALGDTITHLKELAKSSDDSSKQIETDFILGVYRNIRVDKLSEAVSDLYRHIPCHIFHSSKEVTEFTVGPVQFATRETWAQKHVKNSQVLKALIASWQRAEDCGSSNVLIPREVSQRDAIVWTIQNHDWVGTVLIRNRDHDTSHAEASVLVSVALDSLNVVLSAERGSLLTRAGQKFSWGGSRLATTEDGNLVSGSMARLPGLGGHPSMPRRFLDETAAFREAAGYILTAYMEARRAGKDAPWLVERWINAIHWFGEARREDSDFMAVVKYGCALDILSGAGGNITEMAGYVTTATGLTDAVDENGNQIPVRDLLNNVFNDGRSALAHGEAFGLLADRSQDRGRADATVQGVIMSVTEPLGKVVLDKDRMLTVNKEAQMKAFQSRLASNRKTLPS